jgi:glucosylceramidase
MENSMKNIKGFLIPVVLCSFLSCQKTETKTAPLHSYSTVKLFVTAQNSTDRLAPKEPIAFTELPQPFESDPTIIIDANKTFQTIEGFGGALTDASAETFYKLPAEKQQEFLTACFDPVNGNGYNLCRTSIHSCDFSSSSYTYAEVEDDVKLEHFTIEHDLKYRIPFIKAAMQTGGNEMKLFASPWSPPAWMKTNKDMLHGGKLAPQYSQTWADYFVKFVQEYEKQGIPLWGLTVQNEPMAVQIWESCIFTAAEERDFVRDYLGPTLERNGLSRLKLMIWDHNRGVMYQRAKVVYDDPNAFQYVWGTGFHWYVTDTYDNVRLVHDAFPNKKLLFTEGTVASFSWENLQEWRMGEKFAKEIIMDLNNWANGWVFWNVLLDETGGPNHVGNFCVAPIIADTRTGELHYMNSHYYIGHFSRFIKPGAKRIICSSNSDDLIATAFLNPDETIAVVVLNLTDKDMDFDLWLEGKAARTKSAGHSIITMVVE